MRSLIGLAVLLLFFGCESAPETSYVEIFNNSGKDVIISSYRLTYRDSIRRKYAFSREIVIRNQEKYCGDFKKCPIEPGMNGRRVPVSALMGGDSILINYGDAVKGFSLWQNAIETRNPYFLIYPNNSDNFVYTLTGQDFIDAMPKR